MPLGLTINPEFVQVEGIDQVLENAVGRCRAGTVATLPCVLAPADGASGSREPPLDAGAGRDRLLDRALWGRHWLQVRSAPSFAPRRALYAGLAIQPPEPDDLTDREGGTVAAFLGALKRAGVETQIQIMAAAPPCYRVQSRGSLPDAEPLTPDGRSVPGRVDANLSLAHPELRAYLGALIADLVAQYPDMDAVRFDWPEYPPYHPDSLGFDFSTHAMRRGAELGIDAAGLRRQVAALGPELVRVLNAGRLLDIADGVAREGFGHLAAAWPAIGELIAYRSALVVDYARFLAGTVRQASGGRVACVFQCFPPPLNVLSGFAIDRIDGLGAAIGIKLYTMHWPMIERNFVERLLQLGAGDPDQCLEALQTMLGTMTGTAVRFDRLAYPRPHEPHPAENAVIEDKIRTAMAAARKSRIWAVTHGYGPVADVMRRFHAARRAADGYVHVNRYGYLGEDKIAAIAAFAAPATCRPIRS